mmetsp:Transcript_66479/g.185300  ORF Transcript_66479/g.185300 Transcript_66479/m.185300 type:complete len:226 (+) Transcript_66479:496-1173(+)
MALPGVAPSLPPRRSTVGAGDGSAADLLCSTSTRNASFPRFFAMSSRNCCKSTGTSCAVAASSACSPEGSWNAAQHRWTSVAAAAAAGASSCSNLETAPSTAIMRRVWASKSPRNVSRASLWHCCVVWSCRTSPSKTKTSRRRSPHASAICLCCFCTSSRKIAMSTDCLWCTVSSFVCMSLMPPSVAAVKCSRTAAFSPLKFSWCRCAVTSSSKRMSSSVRVSPT